MPREEGGDAMEMDASSPTHGPVPQPTTRPAADREVPSSGPGGLLVPLKTETNNVEVSQAKTEVVAEDMEVESGGQKDTAQQEDPMEGSFTWVIEKYDEIQDKKMYSDNFTIGGYKWRLLIFPKGNGTQHVSLYLDVADSDTLPYCWSRSASFTLSVLNHLDPELSHRKDAQHVFCQKESDWGFTQFLSLDELLNDQKGFVSTGRGGAGGERGSVTIEARVKVRTEDNYFSYDSKKETGHVGLKNQGATCYMNSLLQTLFHLPYFRKAVYHMPTSNEELAHKSLPLALQSLFYKLQFNPNAVSTKDLTRSFGWDTMDAFTQHDVQELNRVLSEKLEEKMKGTSVENTIQHLFEGKVVNYIDCVNVDYKSTRKETFMDLQLDVKGCKDIYESFDKYVEVETLEGDNKYQAEGHGLQDARKGVLFEDFPPVLQLQLKRFEYDFVHDMMVKINQRYEFPEHLDLDRDGHKYLTKDSAREGAASNSYSLYSVLVHSGGVHGGHYYAFIRPDGKQWLKFDDDKVTKVTSEVAVEEQFGGDGTNDGNNNNPIRAQMRFSNAYMLVYIRDADRDHILCDVAKEDIAGHLRERLDEEQKEKERRKKEKQEAHLFTYVRIVTDKDLAAQVGTTVNFDLVDFTNPDVLSLKISKQEKFSVVKAQVAERLGIPEAEQRYWMWAARENQTYRPSKPYGPEEEETKLQDLTLKDSPRMTEHGKNYLNLYLETPLGGSPGGKLPEIPRSSILLFFKLYDVEKQSLTFVGRTFATEASKIRDLTPVLCSFAGYSLEDDLVIYEEIKYEPAVMCEKLERHATLQKCQLENGDIICFQKLPPEDGPEPRHAYVDDYLNYVKNRQMVKFAKREEQSEVIELELSKVNTYNEVTEALAQKIGLDDPTKIRLTAHNQYSDGPRPNPIKYQSYEKLSDMLVQGYQAPTDTLYYEILDIPLFELEKLKSLKIAYHKDTTEECETYTLRLPKDSKVEEALCELRRRIPDASSTEQLRLMEVFYHKIYKTYDAEDKIDSINDQYWTLRAEAVSEEERNMGPADKLVHVYHFTTKDRVSGNTTPMQTFGDPFFFVLREGETVREVRERIRSKLQVSEEEFSKWKVAFITMSKPEYLKDDDVVITKFTRGRDSYGPWENYLGLDHEDKNRTRKKPQGSHYDNKSIKISC